MPNPRPFLARSLGCLLSLTIGLFCAGALLGMAGGQLALAAPASRPLASDIVVTTTIQAAIDAAQAGDNVIIPAGHYTESLTLSKTVSLRGVLSSTTIIHAVAGQRVLTVTGAGINNSTIISGLTIADGNFTDFGGGGGIRVEGFAQPLLQNLIITGNQASSGVSGGGGLYVDAGSPLRLVNVSFFNNTSTNFGGAVYALDALTVEGGVVRNNRCTAASCIGGGLMMGAMFPVDLSEVQFISNTSLSNGGGANVSGRLTVRGGLFEDNSAEGNGGGLWSLSAAAITGTRFISNTSTASGGGAAMQDGGTVQDGLFQGNHCTNLDCTGGGLYGISSPLAVMDTEFISNTADGYGGGGLSALAATTVEGGRFQGNATLNPMFGGFTFGGGGLFSFNALAVTGTEFIDNYAAGNGGGVLHEINVGKIVNGLFVGNSAGAGGDALAIDSFNNSPESFVLLHATLATPAGSPLGAAIHVVTGTLGVTNTIFSNFSVGISRTAGPSTTEDYNLFANVTTPTTGGVAGGGHSVVGTAFFRDANAGDYHLGVGSNALNAAVNAGVPIDAEGDPRPIGSGPDLGYDEARLVTLTLSKTDGQASAAPGTPLTYTILINNTGPSIAAGVLVTDTLPAGLTPGTWTCLASAGSSCPASGNGSIQAVVTIASGSFVQFTLHATVAATATGTILNTVTALEPASVVNTNAPNSSASDSTTVLSAAKKIYLPLLLR